MPDPRRYRHRITVWSQLQPVLVVAALMAIMFALGFVAGLTR